jgi:hypothetical protein
LSATVDPPQVSAHHPGPVSSRTRRLGARLVSRDALILLAVGIGAAAYLVLLTPELGPPLEPDPAAYVGAAENLANGRGLTLPFVPIATSIRPTLSAAFDGRTPLFQYSPGLPIVLAAGRLVGLEPAESDRVLNVIAFAFAAAFVAWVTLRFTRSLVAALGAVGLLLTTSYFVAEFRFVTTEALFIGLSLAALGALAAYVATTHVGWALGFVALAAACALTRFVGISVVVTGALVIARWLPMAIRPRVVRALIIGAASILPVAAWVTHDALAAPGRDGLSVHPPNPLHLFGISVSTLVAGRPGLRWWWPLFWLIGAATVVGVALLLVACARPRSSPMSSRALDEALARSGLVFTAVYTAALLTSMTFVHDAPVKVRYVIPLFPVFVVIGVTVFVHFWRHHLREHPGARVAAVVAVVALTVSHLDAARSLWNNSRRGPTAVTVPSLASWQPVVQELGPEAVVFSNAPHIVSRYTDTYTVAVPARRSIWSGRSNPHYREDLLELGTVLCHRPGAVLLFGRYAAYDALRLIELADIEVTHRFPEGRLMHATPEGCAERRSRQPRAR